MTKNCTRRGFKRGIYYQSEDFTFVTTTGGKNAGGGGLDCESGQGGDIFHGFFGRKGGISRGIFESLNCGLGSGDDYESVRKNREIVAEIAGIDADRLLSVYQVHGSKVIEVKEIWTDEQRPKADAMVTDRAGVGLGILVADCAPVLFKGRAENGRAGDGHAIIGAAHAGWKGALGGVLENTIAAMVDLGAVKSSISACVGPCIGKDSYEVSEEFKKPFLEHDAAAIKFFRTVEKLKKNDVGGEVREVKEVGELEEAEEKSLMFDLASYCKWRLNKAGLSKVYDLAMDTYANEDEFFSYRRSTHLGHKDYGRQIAVISINKGKGRQDL